MQDKSDTQLLREYAERACEPAFRELVTRHTDLVYSSALRQVSSPDLARDIAQSVFTDLARKARTISEKSPATGSLAGWLHRGTRYAALDHLRNTRRRLANERQAMEQFLVNSDSAPEWDRIRPVLDEALDSLGDEDREALLLRYFKNHDFRAVGLALGVSDDAAQKRVSRAVERLREFFAKHGVTVGAGGLATVISTNAVHAAPAGLAAALSTTALAGTTLVTAVTALKPIAMTALQKSLVSATLALAVGAGIYQAHQASTFRTQVKTLQQEQADQALLFENERATASNRLSALAGGIENAKSNSTELLKLRAEVARLRKEADAAALEAKAVRESRSVAVQVISSTPPVRTLTSTTLTTVSWDQAIVTGGWKTPSGKRAFVFATIHPEDGDKGLLISSKFIEFTEDTGKQLGLDQYNVDGQSTLKAHTMTSEQYGALMQAAEKFKDVDILTTPSITTESGRQAEVQAGDLQQTPSGEKYSTGPTLDIIPTISPDHQSVQMVIGVQLNYPIQPSGN